MFAQLLIPRAVYSALLAQAVAELPNECCGLLAGLLDGSGRVQRHFPLVSAVANPVEFESEPRSMFAAVRELRRNGWDVLAVYHSHPTSPPVPSRMDRERSYSAGVVNLIISLQSAQPEVRGWWLLEDEVQEADWQVVD